MELQRVRTNLVSATRSLRQPHIERSAALCSSARLRAVPCVIAALLTLGMTACSGSRIYSGETGVPESNVEATSPHNMTRVRPVIGVATYDEAIAHYVDFLGFTVDWEWREAPGRPAIVAISRDGVEMHLVEGDEHPPNSWFQVHMEDIQTLADELNAKRPGSVEIEGGAPYVQQILLKDPFGNLIVFEQGQSSDDEIAGHERAGLMRDYIRERLAAGHACPTPEEVVEAVCPPATFSGRIQAADVLMEFPEYEEATRGK
jgi:hypothetical protein